MTSAAGIADDLTRARLASLVSYGRQYNGSKWLVNYLIWKNNCHWCDFQKTHFYIDYYTSHLFFKRCRTNRSRCRTAIFTHCISFSTGVFAFTFTYTVAPLSMHRSAHSYLYSIVIHHTSLGWENNHRWTQVIHNRLARFQLVRRDITATVTWTERPGYYYHCYHYYPFYSPSPSYCWGLREEINRFTEIPQLNISRAGLVAVHFLSSGTSCEFKERQETNFWDTVKVVIIAARSIVGRIYQL